MTQPAVNISQLDGALGVLPPTSGELLALIGTSSTGPTDTVATFGRVSDVISNYGYGPLVEAAARHISTTGKPVVVVRAAATTNGAAGTVDVTGVTGTSVVTVDASVHPNDDYEVYFVVTLGGTIGTGPISFQWSLDNGRTLSQITSLGTANTFTIPNSGVQLDFAAGTLVTGDVVKVRTTAPQWSTTDLGSAFDALTNSSVTWGIVEVVGPVDAAAFDVIEAKMATLTGFKKFRMWMGNTRIPDVGESEATYLTSLTTSFASKATIHGALCAGSAQIVSGTNSRLYQRPIVFATASNEANVSPQVDTADVNLGPLVGVSLTDNNGNPVFHDETYYPGLDDARFYVLRSWTTRAGVYVNRPRIFSAQGSDFELVPHRRVMNVALAVVNEYFERVLSKPLLLDAKTGFILESEAQRLENGCNAALAAALGGMASSWSTALSRTDNILSSKTLTGDVRVEPLGYPENVNLSIGFTNPANNLQAA